MVKAAHVDMHMTEPLGDHLESQSAKRNIRRIRLSSRIAIRTIKKRIIQQNYVLFFVDEEVFHVD